MWTSDSTFPLDSKVQYKSMMSNYSEFCDCSCSGTMRSKHRHLGRAKNSSAHSLDVCNHPFNVSGLSHFSTRWYHTAVSISVQTVCQSFFLFTYVLFSDIFMTQYHNFIIQFSVLILLKCKIIYFGWYSARLLLLLFYI